MDDERELRARLRELVDEIRAAFDRREDYTPFSAEFERLLPGTDVLNLCQSDWDNETIVDICLGWQEAQRPLSHDALLDVVQSLLAPATMTEAEKVLLVAAFKANCNHPARSDLIFFPEEHFGGRPDPTTEEIVAKAIAGN